MSIIRQPIVPFIQKIIHGTPQTYCRVTNAKGFNRRIGELKGAAITGVAQVQPYRNNQPIDDGAKVTHYDPGMYPGSMIGDTLAERDAPTSKAESPDSNQTSKAANEAAAEKKIGNSPSGTTGR